MSPPTLFLINIAVDMRFKISPYSSAPLKERLFAFSFSSPFRERPGEGFIFQLQFTVVIYSKN